MFLLCSIPWQLLFLWICLKRKFLWLFSLSFMVLASIHLSQWSFSYWSFTLKSSERRALLLSYWVLVFAFFSVRFLSRNIGSHEDPAWYPRGWQGLRPICLGFGNLSNSCKIQADLSVALWGCGVFLLIALKSQYWLLKGINQTTQCLGMWFTGWDVL